ncbi:hypothetical protein [Aurantibacillus circumpalustris]|uniref:hypothetical protein n=1 Tax=Aurantibacillus circumpalustris TaxID=3036359 RepID=UPI00295BE3AA|nr:hypothetical protein [Aurantibacillus circumpalustris]
MFGDVNLKYELSRIRSKMRSQEDQAIEEAKKILRQDLLSNKKILDNLSLYSNTYDVIDEEDVNYSEIFTASEIKKVAILYRLKFLDHNLYKPEIPDEIEFKIQNLNHTFSKEIKGYKILAPYGAFEKATNPMESTLFVKTNYDNYYLLHRWGKPIKAKRKFQFLPLRNFEFLVTTIFLVTMIIAVSLPTRLITLDHKAEYWSGYRAAAFFHLLIFNFGVTVYFTFAFAKNFSSSVWNSYKDF